LAQYRRGREKLHAALHRLTVHEGDVRARLKSAYFYLRQLTDRDLPEELWEEFSDIKKELHARGPRKGKDGEVWETSLVHTLRRMRNSTGRELAERLHSVTRKLDQND